MQQRRLLTDKHPQAGIALLAMLTLLALWGMYLLLGQLSATQYRATRAHNEASALAEAKQALIGDAVSTASLDDTGYLRLPDVGSGFGVPSEGQASGTFAGDKKDLTVIGKLPWKTLNTAPLRDKDGECLWYVVSGRFKSDTITLKTDVLNWDTQGQIDVADGAGNVLASNLAALLIAPGPALDSQNRAQADAAYTQCGGNYDTRNYLDAFESANAIVGEVNYFAASTNHRIAPDSGNKRFVMTENEHYNDRFLLITVDDIFSPIIRRRDFSAAISTLLNSPAFQSHLQSVVPKGAKGTDTLDCSYAPNKAFCENWKEMLFLAELKVPSSISIDGSPSEKCNRVLLFSGKAVTGQSRRTAAEKSDKNNYLEGSNLTSFNSPTANAELFSGTSSFSWRAAGSDLVRCLP